jgi:peptidoglycan/xylan/chitin deacetylase (PgdA/CDA1 family)
MTSWTSILTFHALEEKSSAISFSPEFFAWGMGRMHARGFTTIDFAAVLEGIRCKSFFPDRSFLITFDDGYESVYREAFPVLTRYNMTATVFLTVGEDGEIAKQGGTCNGRDMLTWRQIREMAEAGIQFGAHTITHPDLTDIGIEQAEYEMYRPKMIIEDKLGVSPVYFAYPYGRTNRRIREAAGRHFHGACTTTFGLCTPKSDPHALERLDGAYFNRQGLFQLLSTRWLPLYVTMRRLPFLLKHGWERIFRCMSNEQTRNKGCLE